MKALKKRLFILIFFLSPLEALAQGINTFYLCKNGQNIRTLYIESIEKDNHVRCQATYTKFGQSHNIGKGWNQQSCEGFLERVKANLEKGWWVCKKQDSVGITSS